MEWPSGLRILGLPLPPGPPWRSRNRGLRRLAAGLDQRDGLAGIREVAEDLASWPQVWGHRDPGVGAGRPPGPAPRGRLFRRLQAACCHDVARQTGTLTSAQSGLVYDRCAEAWSRLGRPLPRCAPDHVAGATEVPAAVLGPEQEGADLLAAAAEGLLAPRDVGARPGQQLVYWHPRQERS